MLTQRQRFKAAFIAHCIEAGHTTPEAIQKQAEDGNLKLASILGSVLDAGKGLAGTVGSVGVPLALAAPPVLGGLAGLTLGKMTDIDDVDVEEAKKREILEELRRQTQRLNHQRTARQFAMTRGG